jgi:hypothetical protein
VAAASIATRRLPREFLHPADALLGCCDHCGRAYPPMTDVRCTSELSGETWHNLYCANCIVVCVGNGYLTHFERAPGAGSIVERITPVIAEPVGTWRPARAPVTAILKSSP